jgi:hypothetical protein
MSASIFLLTAGKKLWKKWMSDFWICSLFVFVFVFSMP